MKELFLIRHAEAHNTLGLPDFDRELTSRGLADAMALGQAEARKLSAVEAIYASAATRTMQTAQAVAQAAGLWAEVMPEEFLYLAHAPAIAQWLTTLPDDLNGLLIVGHNPTMYDLASAMGIGLNRFPKCGMVAIRFDTKRWAHIGPKCRVAQHISFTP